MRIKEYKSTSDNSVIKAVKIKTIHILLDYTVFKHEEGLYLEVDGGSFFVDNKWYFENKPEVGGYCIVSDEILNR